MSDAKKDPLPLAAQLTKGIESVDFHEFAGGIAQEMATLPQIRVGRKWYTTAQILTVLIPLGFVAGLCVVAFAQQIRTIPQVQAFIQEYPGTGRLSHPVQSGFPWWLRYQHYLNLFFMLLMIRSGLQILADHPRLYLDGAAHQGGNGSDCAAQYQRIASGQRKTTPSRFRSGWGCRAYDTRSALPDGGTSVWIRSGC